jgi:hypothetical protein
MNSPNKDQNTNYAAVPLELEVVEFEIVEFEIVEFEIVEFEIVEFEIVEFEIAEGAVDTDGAREGAEDDRAVGRTLCDGAEDGAADEVGRRLGSELGFTDGGMLSEG